MTTGDVEGPDEIGWEAGGLAVAALRWGPPDGPLALCLHGYPDTAWTWRHLGPALAARGWHVVAPFQRGYAPSGLAADGSYQIGALVHDALEVHARFHRGGRSLLVGHDWGAVAAYATGSARPDAFERIVTLAVPPVGLVLRSARSARGLAGALRQLRASGYMAFQQIPGLSEGALPRVVPRLWRTWSPGYDPTEDLAHLEPTLADPARRTAILRYYRAFAQPWYRKPAYRDHQRHALRVPPVPLLYLYGADDGCLRRETVERAAALLPSHCRFEVVSGAGHFLHLEQPGLVNGAIVAFAGDPA